MDCKVLVSLDESYPKIPKIISKYFRTKLFDICKDNYTVNAGLMMGYVKYLTIAYDKIIHGPSKNDQRNLNLACKELPFIKIDINHTIFQNISNLNELDESNAYLCQFPGMPSFNRYFRSIKDYGYFNFTSIFQFIKN